MKKIKRAVTDSGSEIRFSEGNHGISNLITIYSSLSGYDIGKVEDEFDGKTYSSFKESLADLNASGGNVFDNTWYSYEIISTLCIIIF